jgi:hypothetical protein
MSTLGSVLKATDWRGERTGGRSTELALPY